MYSSLAKAAWRKTSPFAPSPPPPPLQHPQAAIAWLEEHPDGDVTAIDSQLRQLEAKAEPLMRRMGMGASHASPGPGAGAGEDAGSGAGEDARAGSGPDEDKRPKPEKIEEIDD